MSAGEWILGIIAFAVVIIAIVIVCAYVFEEQEELIRVMTTPPEDPRERARQAFQTAMSRGANVGPLLAELERGWARQDNPEPERRISEMVDGEVGWTAPWAVQTDGQGGGWINSHYRVAREAGGTSQVRVKNMGGTIHVWMPAGRTPRERKSDWCDRPAVLNGTVSA